MIKKVISLALLVTIFNTAMAQTPDKNINKLCGCFEVEFKYAETFSPNQIINFLKEK
ncbi:MAG: hypothetical protein IPP96_03575 [Chitinophagaceae bacterium]|nr:hypothetical protein [Chitinophagaceae bacterium]